MSLIVKVAEPTDYADAGRVTAHGYRADDLLRRRDGRIDVDYGAQLTDAARRAQEAELLVAVEDGHVLGSVTWCPPTSPWRELATHPDQAEFRMLSVAAAGRRRGVRPGPCQGVPGSGPSGGNARGAVVLAAANDRCPCPLSRVRLRSRSRT